MYLLLDIGATNSRIAVSKDGTELNGDPVIIETPSVYETAIEVIYEQVQKMPHADAIEAISGGIANPFNRKEQVIASEANLVGGWGGKYIAKDFSDRFGVPAYFENDAALVGLGEAHYGAGRGANILVYVTVSTGVGGARIEQGRISDHVFSFEPGHQIIDIDGTFIPQAEKNTLGALISGSAIEKRTGKKPYEIMDEAFWDEIARILAIGLHNMIVHWSPETIVLGGSMFKDIGIKVDRVGHYLKEYSRTYPVLPKLIHSELGDIGGLYGALVRVQQEK